jgi:spore coat protein SA
MVETGVRMPNITYHLLTEAEPFSEFSGGAISRWAGNVLRDNAQSVVVCPSADDTWQFPPQAVSLLPALKLYRIWRKPLGRLPWFFHHRVIRTIFRPLLGRLRPRDIVWIHNRPEFAVALTPYIHRAAARVVLHLHNSHLVEGPEWLMSQVRVDRLVFVSQFLRQQAHDKFPQAGASSVLYNGADQSIFYPAADHRKNSSPVTVLFAGRLVEDKGVHVLLDAMKLLAAHSVPLRAIIVGSSGFGSGKETEYIRRLKATSPGTVEFVPYRSGRALGELFRAADMFCSPSIWDEPFGLVNVEALASGLPVVSTLGGGASEIFARGGGILVERKSAAQLASALRRLAESPELRARLGQQGYAAFLERFTWSEARTRVQQIQNALCG